MKALLILCIGAVAALAQPATPVKKAPATGAAAATGTTAPKTVSAAPSLMNPASLKAKAPDLFRVKFATTHGDFVVEVHRDWAPLGADRFYNLVRARFFTDQAFYRYASGFIVQFGVSANPAVTAVWQKATIKDEPVKEHNVKGTITFAKSSLPNSRSTDFFINLGDNSRLDPDGFAPFGTVTEGMDIVEGLYKDYGEMKEQGGRGPSQEALWKGGKAYTDKNFPKLDTIKSATVIFPEPATAAKKAATGAPAKSGAPATKTATPPAPAKKQ